MAVYDVGPIEEFPINTHKVVNAGKFEVGIFNLNGSLFALLNFCPHQQGPLCEGPTSGEWTCSLQSGWKHEFGRKGEIAVCPWHGIEFDIKSGACLSSRKLKARTYNVAVEDGRVTISTERATRGA